MPIKIDSKIIILIVLIALVLLFKFVNINKNNAQQKHENFDASRLPSKPIVLTLYYTEWCGYSKKFQPIWAELNNFIKDNKLNITTAKVDCEKNKCQVSGYPTVILNTGTKEVEMNDYPRTVDGILAFVNANL